MEFVCLVVGVANDLPCFKPRNHKQRRASTWQNKQNRIVHEYTTSMFNTNVLLKLQTSLSLSRSAG